jgi:hypothetical protein
MRRKEVPRNTACSLTAGDGGRWHTAAAEANARQTCSGVRRW